MRILSVLASLSLFLAAATEARAQIVISAFFGGGGNTSAPYNADFVELANNSSVGTSVTGYSLQYASSTGTTIAGNVALPSPLNIAPKSYFLVKISGTGANGIAVPFDADGSTIAASGTGGKIYLVSSTTNITNLDPATNTSIVDMIGFGTTATHREGSGTANNAPAPSNTTGLRRTVTSFNNVDTNVNSADFSVWTIATSGTNAPRNSASTQFPVALSQFSAE